jgi:hypothetical protein
MKEAGNVYRIVGEKFHRRHNFGDLGTDVKIILKYILEK